MIISYLKERLEGAGKSKISRSQVLASRPLRNPLVAWEPEERENAAGRVALLKIPRRNDKFGNVIAKWFRLPDHRKLELDEIGTEVWAMCDGTNNVDALTRALCAKYHLNRRQAETSVTAYLRMLAERRLIVLEKHTLKTSKTAGKDKAAAGAAQRRTKRA